MKKNPRTKEQFLAEIEDLRRRLEEAEETLRAIHEGEVDALVLSRPQGDVVFTLKGAESPYRVFVEAMNEGAATLDPEGTILYCNNRFAEMLKLPADRVIGSSIYRFIPLPDRSGFESAFQGGKQQDITVDISLKREDQDLIPVHLSFNMLHGQNMPILCMVAMDLTEHKRLEEALRQFNVHLEKRVEDRTAELIKVNEILRTEITERKRAEGALQESQILLHAVMENASDPVYVKDRQGRILMCNPALEKVAGKPAAEIIGKTDSEYYGDPILGQALREHDLRVMELGRSQTTEETVKNQVFLSSKAPYRNESGDIIGIVGISHDITERKRAAEAQRKSQQLFSTLFRVNPGATILSSLADGKCVDANEAYAKLTGYTREELVGKTTVELNIWTSAGERQSVVTELARMGHLENVELTLRRKNGEVINTMASGEVITIDGQRYILSFFFDITERKRAEEQLRRSRDELEIRVQERTSELAKANETLRDLSARLLSAQEEERKRIARELHDTIGSCLNGIKFRVEMALQQLGKTADIAAESLSAIIPVIQEGIEECRRMQQDLRPSMLDDLGLLTTLSWFCRRHQTIYTGTKVELEQALEERDIPDSLKVVIFRVTQEGMNNIAKHSQANLVHLSLRKMDGRIELVLEDNGQGFDLKKVFASESTKRGLGLTSMRERTELSGGSFVIKSAEGKGTTIRVSWPAGPEYS